MTEYLSAEEQEALAEEAAKKQRLRRDNELNDLRLICDTEHGRRFIWRLLEQAGVWRPPIPARRFQQRSLKENVTQG